MRPVRVLAVLAALLVSGSLPRAQPIIAQNAGLTNPNNVITFGAGLYPNFTNITTQFAGIVVTHARYFTTGVSNNLVGGFLTNDFSALPNTLRIVFASPIRDLSFVYHQIGGGQQSVFRAVLAGTTVASFSNLSNQAQPNNYFGFQNVVFDELQLDFIGDFNVDTLAYNNVSANCTVRNGLGINPVDFSCATLPVLGSNWISNIATNPNTIATYLVIAPDGPHPGYPFAGGEVLVQLSALTIVIPGPGSFSIPVPNSSTFLGLQVPVQGIRIDTVGPAQNLVLLNALDLVLGL